MWLILYRI